MTCVTVSRAVKAFTLSVVGVLFLALPAQADPITLNFSGSVDLTSEGGPAVNVFNGSLTWESTAVPFEIAPGVSSYDPLSYTLFFNGVDVSEPVIGDGTGSGITVSNDADPFGSGVVGDFLSFFFEFDLSFPIASTGENELGLIGVLMGPTTMFDSTDLPANLDFLTQLTGTQSLFFVDPDIGGVRFLDLQGPLVVSAPEVIPEPAALALIALGLAGALARARRGSKIR